MNQNEKSGNGFTPKRSQKEKIFLEGPQPRRRELVFLIDVIIGFIKGFRALHFTYPCITVFGSARFDELHPYYMAARQIGSEIAQLGFTVMTGGGPGIMEAANRGAREAGGVSIGCNIVLAHEQKPNQYLDKWVDIDYFFIRKVLLTKYSYGFVVMPGGYGTLDEFFESIELIQTGKMQRFPIILFGKAYHAALFEHLQRLRDAKTIDADDLDLFLFTDSVQEVYEYLKLHAIDGFGLKRHRIMRPFGILGEKGLRNFFNKHFHAKNNKEA